MNFLKESQDKSTIIKIEECKAGELQSAVNQGLEFSWVELNIISHGFN